MGRKQWRFFLLLVPLMVLASPRLSTAHAAFVELAWDANRESSLAGYRVHWGSAPGRYDSSKNVGKRTGALIAGLTAGRKYYFAVTAYTLTGGQSAYSNVVAEVIAELPPDDNDGDGIKDDADPDDDNDGLDDDEEAEYGTDPANPDSDDDGVKDGQEVADGSDPLDAGSNIALLDTTICAEWNGFLGMWNVLEHVNLSSRPLRVFLTLYDITGRAARSIVFDVAARAQFDALVHDVPGFRPESYGKICSSHDGNPGDLDGRMVYYRPKIAPEATVNDFEFGLSMPMTNGMRGRQYVSYNTYQPSFALEDQANPVANWIQLTSLSAREEHGQLRFYDMEGSLLDTIRVVLAPSARQDFSAHAFGPNRVGLVEWQPQSASALFTMRNVRYVYDNPTGGVSFDTAFQLQGMRGTGRRITLPLDTAGATSVLEIANVAAEPVIAAVVIYNAQGQPQRELTLGLAPKASFHLIADPLLNGAHGTATIESGRRESIVATAMQYGRLPDMSISYVYGLEGREALGGVLRGSYNTFIEQSSELWLANAAEDVVAANLQMVRSDSALVLSGHDVAVPGHGLSVVDLNQFEAPNNYGVVTVQTNRLNRLIASVLRKRRGQYVLPSPVRQ